MPIGGGPRTRAEMLQGKGKNEKKKKNDKKLEAAKSSPSRDFLIASSVEEASAKQQGKKGRLFGTVLHEGPLQRATKEGPDQIISRGDKPRGRKWRDGYFVLTTDGIWGYRDAAAAKKAIKSKSKAQGWFLFEEASKSGNLMGDIVTDTTAEWFQICHPERVLTFQAADRGEDIKSWIDAIREWDKTSREETSAAEELATETQSALVVKQKADTIDWLQSQPTVKSGRKRTKVKKAHSVDYVNPMLSTAVIADTAETADTAAAADARNSGPRKKRKDKKNKKKIKSVDYMNPMRGSPGDTESIKSTVRKTRSVDYVNPMLSVDAEEEMEGSVDLETFATSPSLLMTKQAAMASSDGEQSAVWTSKDSQNVIQELQTPSGEADMMAVLNEHGWNDTYGSPALGLALLNWFRAYDIDGGGTIVHGEVEARNAALKQATGIEAEYSADDVMTFFGDGDEDGELSLREFLSDATGEDAIFSEDDIPKLEAIAARFAALPGNAALTAPAAASAQRKRGISSMFSCCARSTRNMTNTTTAMSRMTMSLSKSAAIASAEMAAKMAKQMDVVGVAGLLWTTPLAERETRMSFQPFDDVSEATSLTLQQCSGDLLRIDQLPGIEVTEADIVPEDPVEAFEEKIQELEEERKEAAVMMVVDLRHGPVVAAIDEELMTLRTELEELKEKVDAERREKMGLTSTLTNATVNIVANCDVPVGIHWQFQDENLCRPFWNPEKVGRAVIADLWQDSELGRHLEGRGVCPGMVLMSYKSGYETVEVTYKAMRKSLKQKRKLAGGTGDIDVLDVAKHLAETLQMASRPVQLNFQATAPKRSDALTFDDLEFATGCNVMPLKIVVPPTPGDLGIKWWRTYGTKGAPFIGDLYEPGIIACEKYQAQGIRPGMRLVALQNPERVVKINGEEPLDVIVQHVTMMHRPFEAIFEPVPVALQYTFGANVAPQTASDRAAVKTWSQSSVGGQEKGWSIIRELGVSWKEEHLGRSAYGGYSGERYRVRVVGVHPGGLVDRFNRKSGHPLVRPGMTLVSIKSPYFERLEVENMPLHTVVEHMHKAAPAITIKFKTPGRKKVTLAGREITLGFKVDPPAPDLESLDSAED